MNKTIKKSLSVLSSAAVMASIITVPAITASAEGKSAVYSGGKLTVTSDKAVNADVYVASYNSDNTLKGVTKKTVALNVGDTAVDVAANVGDKIFVWDEKDTPIVGALTIEAEQPSEEVTDIPATEQPSEDPDIKVIKSWKFDFGSAEDVSEGYTYVAPDRNYTAAGDYGFLGTDENDWRLGNRYDGFGTQEGQVITLSEGGGTGLNDGIGSTGADLYGNAGDKYYPTRFALKVEDEQYFRVKATVTTLDSTKPATASLYTERKHPLYTEKQIAAGETITTEFTIRTTPIYYEKSEPKGAIKDEMVNVSVLGENTALASLEIDQIEDAATLWVLGDSTVTDGNCNLPYFPLHNYTGVGTGLTKYLPKNIAMVNEGEGGLSAADNYHFNMVKSRIKAGDYMYVEYGHNHKDDGPTGYKACLDKYYDACHAVGANLIIVSPVQSLNSWNSETKRWNDRFGGETNFAGVGKAYVAEKQAAGADDIAFVDLTKTSVEWVDKVTADNGDSQNAARFYYRTPKGGGTDASHPNDLGAENFAYCFFTAAKEVTDETQKAVLEDLLTGMRDETPNLVSDDIVAGGLGGTAWPVYFVPTSEKYPVQIKRIDFNEDGTAAYAKVNVVNAEIPLDAYGIIVITVKDADGNEVGKIYAVDQVDNSTGLGTQEIRNFTTDITLPEDGSYTAMVWKAVDSNEGLIVDPENVQYSWEYVSADIVDYLLPGETGDVETFEYYGKDNLNGAGKWTYGGSAGADLALDKDSNVPYVSVSTTNTGNSYFVMRPLENLTEIVGEEAVNIGTGSSGKYMVSADIMYEAGGDVTYALAKSIKSSSPFAEDIFNMFTIGASGKITVNGEDAGTLAPMSWTNVQYILDMDNGTASISVAGAEAKVVSVPMYDTNSVPTIDTLKNFVISGGKGASFTTKVSNLTIAQLKQDKLPDKTLTVSTNETDDADMGAVSIAGAESASYTAQMNTIVTVNAETAEGYEFVEWQNEDGSVFAYTPSATVRMHNDVNLKAIFKAAEYDPIEYLYKEDFSKAAASTDAGWSSKDGGNLLVIKNDTTEGIGNYLDFTMADKSRGAEITFADTLTSENGVAVQMNFKLGKPNRDSNQIVFHGGNIAFSENNKNYGYVSGGIIVFEQTSDGAITVNGNATTIPAGAWVSMAAVCDFAAHTVNIKVTSLDGETEYYSADVEMPDTTATGFKGMYTRAGRNYGAIALDNVKIFSADQLTAE